MGLCVCVCVCDWTREETTKESFDKAAMKATHPDLYAEFTTVGASTTAVVPARDRGFQMRAHNLSVKFARSSSQGAAHAEPIVKKRSAVFVI